MCYRYVRNKKQYILQIGGRNHWKPEEVEEAGAESEKSGSKGRTA